MLGTSGLQIAAGLDEDDGYAPFGSATPEPANRNGFGHEQRRPYAEEQQDEGDDGSEAGRQSDVYNETEADADEGEEQARLIDELVRQLLYARHELEQRAAELESRDCQIRYLQEALVAKENACNRLQAKLDTLSQALGSRLARVTCGAWHVVFPLRRRAPRLCPAGSPSHEAPRRIASTVAMCSPAFALLSAAMPCSCSRTQRARSLTTHTCAPALFPTLCALRSPRQRPAAFRRRLCAASVRAGTKPV